MKRTKTLSIIIPVYNEQAFIKKVIDNVIKSDSLGLKKEIVVVNDGSTDGTKSCLRLYLNNPLLTVRKKQNSNPKGTKFIILNQPKNQGKGAAVKIGLLKSSGDIVLIQDADLEYSPVNYPDLLNPFFQQDADVVYGSRFISQKVHRILYFWHFMGNIALTALSNAFTNLNLTDLETGYKVFRGRLIRDLAPRLKSKKFGFEPEITAKIAKIPGLKIYEVGISYLGRTYSEGKKIGWKDGLLAVWEIFKYNLGQ